MVPIEDTIKGFNMILDGEVDDLPEQAFMNVGTVSYTHLVHGRCTSVAAATV